MHVLSGAGAGQADQCSLEGRCFQRVHATWTYPRTAADHPQISTMSMSLFGNYFNERYGRRNSHLDDFDETIDLEPWEDDEQSQDTCVLRMTGRKRAS